MDFNNHKYKLIVGVCLLKSEQDRIKEIINSYNIRLEQIYNNLCSLLDDLDNIN